MNPSAAARGESTIAARSPTTPVVFVVDDDVSLPDLSGLELQEHVARYRTDMPIIFITGHGDIPMTVQAMKAGAVEFLTKPFGDEVLLGAIRQALSHSTAALAQEGEVRVLLERYASL